MRAKIATGDDIVPGDIFKLLRKCGLRTLIQQINNTYETGEWSKNMSDVNNDCLEKKPRATKMKLPSHNQLDHK